MKRTSLFKYVIILVIFVLSSNGQSSCPCGSNGDILRCEVSASSVVNTNSCRTDPYNSINIIYTGNVILDLTASSNYPIVIKPVGASDSHTLHISKINTKATRIEIQIYLSANQISSPLFTSSSAIIAPSSTLSIEITQNIPDAIGFKVFGSSSTTMIFSNYELIFNTPNPNSGSLYLPNLIFGLTSLTSILISGNNHALVVDSTQMPSSINVTQLSLKNLRLYDQILFNFNNLQRYSIEGCQYDKTSLFLNSNQNYTISLEMKNNKPLDAVLPFHADAFKQLGKLNNLVLIEPKLNSSCLKAIQNLLPTAKVLINLGEYYKPDLIAWGIDKPTFAELTIQNIKDLSVFPAMFFNKFHAIERATLQGTFDLDKSDICIFVGIMRQFNAIYPIVILNSTKEKSNQWNNCAETYITAINQKSINDVKCLPGNTCEDCQEWADETDQCDLISYENACIDQIERRNVVFFYNNSQLYEFFKRRLWLNGTTYPSRSSPEEDRINIGAIIGAVCGLIGAIIILGLTILCINRYRQKDANKKMFSTPEEKYTPSSYDPTHISIATSKTSRSSRYALEKSFFPPMQPNDEIAPPLYTAPSESVRSVSAYNLPPAPSAPRDSISTHATHVYETVDS